MSPAAPSPRLPSRRRLGRLARLLPRLLAMLDELDLPDRKSPLPPGFAGPRLRLVNEQRRRLGVTPFALGRRPRPADLFVALALTLAETKPPFLAARRALNRHAYPRFCGEPYNDPAGSEGARSSE